MDATLVPDHEPVLEFWFGDAAATDPVGTAKSREDLWWGAHPPTDRLIEARFGALRLRAIAWELQAWWKTPRGRLAAIILVDQFSRSIHRGTLAAFSSDNVARNLCIEGLERGHDAALAPLERVFFYLPLEHSERMPDQERSVALFEALAREVPEAQRKLFESYADFARRHRDIVARFGRFPHRNRILRRESTAEEAAFLQQPGSSF